MLPIETGSIETNTERLRKKTVTVVPYMHKVAHNMKKVADRHCVHVVFAAPKKLAGLCPRVGGNGKRRSGCGKKAFRNVREVCHWSSVPNSSPV